MSTTDDLIKDQIGDSEIKQRFSILKVPVGADVSVEGGSAKEIGWMDEGDEALLLNLTGDTDHAKAARTAMRTYIRCLEFKDPEMAKALEDTVNEEDRKANGG